MLENVSTFLLRLVLTLISLVSSVSSLSALIQLFSSNRFQASLDSFGYLAFCLLFLPLPCCYFSFVASFFCCLFVVYCTVGNGLLVPLSLTAYLRSILWMFFICMFLSRVIIFQGWICAYITQSGESCRLDESVLSNSDLVAREVRRIADGLSIQWPGDSINRLCCVQFTIEWPGEPGL